MQQTISGTLSDTLLNSDPYEQSSFLRPLVVGHRDIPISFTESTLKALNLFRKHKEIITLHLQTRNGKNLVQGVGIPFIGDKTPYIDLHANYPSEVNGYLDYAGPSEREGFYVYTFTSLHQAYTLEQTQGQLKKIPYDLTGQTLPDDLKHTRTFIVNTLNHRGLLYILSQNHTGHMRLCRSEDVSMPSGLVFANRVTFDRSDNSLHLIEFAENLDSMTQTPRRENEKRTKTENEYRAPRRDKPESKNAQSQDSYAAHNSQKKESVPTHTLTKFSPVLLGGAVAISLLVILTILFA